MLLKAIFLIALVFQAPVQGQSIGTIVAGILSLFNRVPIGTVVMHAGNTIPDRWLLCNGQAVSRTTYSWLFSRIGTAYGAPDSLTFNLPDFRTRFPRGLPTGGSNGVSGNRDGQEQVTLTENELPAHSHGAGSLGTTANGVHSHTIVDPGHDHSGSTGEGPNDDGPYIPGMCSGNTNNDGLAIGTHSHSIPSDTTGITVNPDGTHTHGVTGTTASAGSGQPFSILPPYQNINFIIYAGHSS